MPQLPDPDAVIRGPGGPRNPARPSPSLDGLRLERVSAKERTYLGRIVGVDVPLLTVDSGFGEAVTVNTGAEQL